jgi:hypothetical protein
MPLPLRRQVAFAAILAIAWSALWPLVSASHALLAEEPVMLCHQAGSMVAPDEMPQKPDGETQGKVHCPLCIFAFYATPAAPLAVPEPAVFARATLAIAAQRVVPQDSQLSIPPSRAPPALVPA